MVGWMKELEFLFNQRHQSFLAVIISASSLSLIGCTDSTADGHSTVTESNDNEVARNENNGLEENPSIDHAASVSSDEIEIPFYHSADPVVWDAYGRF